MKNMPTEGFSRRGLLSVVYSLFDLLGLLMTFKIRINYVMTELLEMMNGTKQLLKIWLRSMSLGEENLHRSKTFKSL